MFWDLGGQEELQSLWDKVRRMHRPPASHAVSLQVAPSSSPRFSRGPQTHLLYFLSAALSLSLFLKLPPPFYPGSCNSPRG